MKHTHHRTTWGIATVIAAGVALGLSLAMGQQPAKQKADEPERPYPACVTGPTRGDPKTLGALETPGVVFFAEDCESPESLKKYFEIQGEKDGRFARTSDAAAAHTGSGAMRCTSAANDGKSSGAGANYWFGEKDDKASPPKPGGFERVHFRCYMKWDEGYDQGNLNHTGGSLAGVAGDNKWGGMGGAGKRPAGDDNFSTRFEASVDWKHVAPPGYMFNYTYWMDMKIDKDGHYWGNMLAPEPAERFVPQRGKWYCMEEMVKVNTIKGGVAQADGELATWIDGKLYTHFTGFRWRSSDDVRLKRMGFGVYVHAAAKDNTVWYDDLALSTGYIGPVKSAPASPAAHDRDGLERLCR